MALLHFGLREGGALFLGTSETVGGAEELFQPVDKKWRIYRRVGSTRTNRLAFPVVRVPAGPADRSPPARTGGLRLSVPHLTDRVLLERYTPPAVTVDRDHRVLYYHGDTNPFLGQPRGEPTRDLLALARESVRGAIRVAMTTARQTNAPATARDGTIQADGGPRRVFVTAAPLDPHNAPDTFLVSFELQPEADPAAAAAAAAAAGDPAALRDELAGPAPSCRARSRKLQTSNEELKASNEEVTSVNEELQSTNEELETSKEELQSLQRGADDRQRPAPGEDGGARGGQQRPEQPAEQHGDRGGVPRPPAADPPVHPEHPRPDRADPVGPRAAAERPAPQVRRSGPAGRLPGGAGEARPHRAEVTSESGRVYARRVLPYRTTDNRIDGIVVTFVDVTDRRRARDELEAARHYADSIVETLHEPLLVLHPDLTVKSANAAFYRAFKVIEADTVGRKIYDLGNGQWQIPALRSCWRRCCRPTACSTTTR
jgi:FtsZ-binding cell division protein ZapB